MSLYERLARPLLFRWGGGDAETVHERTVRMLSRVPGVRHPLSPPGARRTVFGVDFPNPVGLAAGMDKDGRALRAWPRLGFGFVEVGTVTRHAQPGNDRPRLFRLPEHEAIVNRMGFNNAGAEALAARLRALGPLPVPLGISLGKSKVTPLAGAVEDYVHSFRQLYRLGDYFAVNVSSPNTPGLRELQDKAQLSALLGALRAENPEGRPVLVKVAPDLTEAALGELLDVCLERGVAGLIATNTTVERPVPFDGPGGLSGRPLAARAVEVVRFVAKESGLPVIGVGGITRPDDARRMVDAGASLVQLYSGLIYHGPGLVRGCIAATRFPL
ncbi:quinone-dependent dihydroorotate dehydrogenase [Dactylosporangium sp. AC04546]|uniref:quinone-dependent dihydroorotate dehydrogenase n=1 Tax=Dactylosporangium sp. AC04546 TaxID=2862460 RepID=UPI001EDDFFB9|nr:quinone-dependent dihydroorotate dehydrogenase [Dactylosporangium sp. AC04546]WVK81682.1 quinone-dependent dihydroorotate dehydrogenase [Dactylosporangium sp. AC04546]